MKSPRSIAALRRAMPAALAAILLAAATVSYAQDSPLSAPAIPLDAVHPDAQSWAESVAASFTGADPANPIAGVIQAYDGNFYGTTYLAGAHNDGSIFRVTPAGVLTTLYSFCSQANCADGENPNAALVQGPDGNLYGTTLSGGAHNTAGTIFSITPSGTFTTLYSFCTQGNCSDGDSPYAGLALAANGSLYGATAYGGTNGNGSFFQFTPPGTFHSLYSFCVLENCADGEQPYAAPVQGSDGNFYGTTYSGGSKSSGIAYQITPAGQLTPLYTFCSQGGQLCTDGDAPNAGLVQGNDGAFYGTTYGNGSSMHGTVFRVTASMQFSTLHSFCSAANCTDGEYPSAALALAADGNFYGTTAEGGTTSFAGTAYQITPSGSLTTLYSFCGQIHCADGDEPIGGLIQGNDGSFYGTTADGGSQDDGAVFKLTATPALAAPVQVTLDSTTILPKTSTALHWTVANAPSLTMQQCYAYVQGGLAGAGPWSGKQVGTYNASTKLFTGSATIDPTADGTYTYALTCGGIESGFATLTVGSPKASSTTVLTATPNPSVVGQTVTLKAVVSGANGTPAGTATFSVAGNAIATITLAAGSASLPVSTTGVYPGSYPLVATYSGDTTYNASSSPSYNVIVNPGPTTTTLKATPNPVTPPATLTFTATVKRSASGAVGAPTGSVTFYYSTIALDTATLNASGVATYSLSTSGLPAGTYPITAKYSADFADEVSTSTAVSVTVK